jgi:hypothetical protein
MVRLIGQTQGGLTDLIAAAGLGPQSEKNTKTSHKGFGIALTYGQLGGTIGLGKGAAGGSDASLNSQLVGGTFSYLFELGDPWGLDVFFRTMGASGDPKSMVSGLPKTVKAADNIQFNMLGVEGRYWLANSVHAGALFGYAQDTIHFKQPAGATQERGKAAGGLMFGASFGWQGPSGFMADAEYLMMSASQGGAFDHFSGPAVNLGYRF